MEEFLKMILHIFKCGIRLLVINFILSRFKNSFSLYISVLFFGLGFHCNFDFGLAAFPSRIISPILPTWRQVTDVEDEFIFSSFYKSSFVASFYP